MKFARRLELVPPYLFAELERKIEEKRKAGIDVISLGIGEPKHPTPAFIKQALAAALQIPGGWLVDRVAPRVLFTVLIIGWSIATIMLGCLASLLLTMAAAKRVDHAWKLVRRAAGHRQERGALERIFASCVGIAVVAFAIWFLFIQGPGPSMAPGS